MSEIFTIDMGYRVGRFLNDRRPEMKNMIIIASSFSHLRFMGMSICEYLDYMDMKYVYERYGKFRVLNANLDGSEKLILLVSLSNTEKAVKQTMGVEVNEYAMPYSVDSGLRYHVLTRYKPVRNYESNKSTNFKNKIMKVLNTIRIKVGLYD